MIDACNVLDIARQDDVETERRDQRFEPLGLRLALIGEGKLGALRRNRLGDAPGNRMIIGNAHDQSTLAFHQILHRRRAPLIVRTSSPGSTGRSSNTKRCRMPTVANTGCPAFAGHDDMKTHASSRLKTSVALVPPKPKEFDSTVPSLALSMRLRTIGMSANTGSSSLMWALSQMKPLFIINRQ